MLRLAFFFFFAVLLGGCASTQPLGPNSVEDLKKSKSAVVFFDGVERINYNEDKYLVLAVATVSSNSAYQGFWDSSVDISALQAEEFSKIGLQAQSFYTRLSGQEKTNFLGVQKEMYDAITLEKDSEKRKDLSLVLKPKLREQLLAQGYDYLIWSSWSGFLLHIHTLGVSPMESFVMNYWIHDLKQNRTIWQGNVGFLEKVDFSESSGKEFLEKNKLAGLKREVEKMIRARYTVRTGRGFANESVGQIMGIEPKN